MSKSVNVLACSGLVLWTACSSSPEGGWVQSASGGTSASGAAPSASIGGALSGSGGDSASAGGTVVGGTAPTGGAASGEQGTGGAATSGGAASVGGAAATGGAESEGTGGAASTGSGGAGIPLEPKFIGNIVHKNEKIIPDFADHWMQVTMEANAKWGFVQPNSATDWVWEPVDEVYSYAKEHGIVYKQHNFFWNFEQPSWVTNSNVATAAETWVKTFCERYPDIAMIDVVNEPLTHAPPYKDGLGGNGTSGHDWVVNTFKLAKKHCPNAILLVNDYNIVEWPNDHAAFVTLLEKVLAAGAPIDALGVQGHDVYAAGVAQTKMFLDDFTERFDLPIYVTEFDIDLANDADQLAIMQEAIEMFWAHPNVHGITYWGFKQGSTWRANAYLVRSNGTDRPALTWLKDFVAAHR